MFQRLCSLLEDAGAQLSPEELQDVLWLAVTTETAGSTGSVATAEPAGVPDAASRAADGDDGTGEPVRDRSTELRQDHDEDDERSASGGLFAPGGARRAAARPARSVDVRGVPALPGARGMARALRPLRQSVPSRRSQTLDEVATADWIADTGLLDAVLRPARERWLSVALVVDDGPSMVLWRQLAAEIQALLERQGAFLHVRVHGLDSSSAVEPVLTARPYAAGAPRRGPGHLTDLSGRTAVLVLSDGVGPGWRSGAIPRVLLGWARHSPVAVVQPLPPRMWPESGMPTQQLLVSADRPGAPGRFLSARHPVLPPGLASYEGTVVPVLDLSAAQVGAWAQLTATGRGSALLPAMLLRDGRAGPAEEAMGPSTALAAEERLRRFRAAASPESQRLAGALASVSPLTLPVMRLIHQAAGNGAGRFHPAQLAEVFLGGLLRRREPATVLPHDAVEYEFQPGVADLLLDVVQTATALDTAAQVTDYLLRRRGGGPEFRARLADAAGDSSVAEHAQPFAAASRELLRRLGLLDEEPYEDEREREGGRPAPGPQPPETATEPVAFPPRSYSSERVQPPLIALVRRIAEDDGLPESVRTNVDKLLTEADQRDEETGWWGVRTLRRLAADLVATGRTQDADALRDVARALLPEVVTADDLETRNMRGHLALTLNALGDHDEGERQLREVIALSARVHGHEHNYTLYARDYLIELLEEADRREAAEEECRALIDAYQRRGREEGEDREAILSLRLKQGRYLIDLDRSEEAEAVFRALHPQRLSLKGPAHFDTVIVRVWLATALQHQKRYAEAEEEVRAAVADAPPPSPDEEGTAWYSAQFRLGYILDAVDRYDEALELWGGLAERLLTERGPRDWRTLTARRRHIYALCDLERHAEAEEEARELAPEVMGMLGERHPDHLNLRHVHIKIIRELGRPEEAADAFRKLLRDRSEVQGSHAPGTLNTRHELAYTLNSLGRSEEAIEEYTAAVEQYERNGQGDEANALTTRNNRASVLEELKRYAEAETERRVTLERRGRVLGPEHPDTLTTRRRLADLLRDQDRFEEAAQEYRHVIDARTRTLGADAPLTLAVRHSLAYVLHRMERFAEAVTEGQETLNARLRVLGAEDAQTLWTRHNLGIALRGLGRLDEAEAEWRGVLEVSERVLGEEHTCTRATRKLLTELREEEEQRGGPTR
ncbi:SAV_2336 N-terminal domain-related protein [Streptomyces sp. NPDC053560]|uniref:SAV_2336 N-terminal domain-related protein n=1 Tax=Streptomyces sp. NPDC053560 TaxID=3365711 RepID=UPI0037D0E10A